MIGQAIPSYAPRNAAQYFRKLDCFCFTTQTLKAGESRLVRQGPSPQTDTPGQQVENAAESPQPVPIVPASLAADTLDGREGHLG